MDDKDSEKKVTVPARRPTTRSSMKGTSGLASSAALKRRRRGAAEDQTPDIDVNGSNDDEDGDSEDGESPNKKSKVETDGSTYDHKDEVDMEVQEKDANSENTEDQEMTQTDDVSVTTLQPARAPVTQPKSTAAVNMNPCVMLHRRPPIRTGDLASDRLKTSRDETDRAVPAATFTRSAPERRPAEYMSKVTVSKSSMAQYREKMEAKAKTNDIPKGYVKRPLTSEASYAPRQCVNNIPVKRKPDKSLHKLQGVKKSATKGSAGSPSRGSTWWLVLLLLLLVSAALLAYKFPALRQHADGRDRTSTPVSLDQFTAHLSALEAQFPRQRAELWKRSRIHLSKHLQMDDPTEPVSLILTSGRDAEKTLHCLAQGLASAFSAVLNASVLHIDGASKAHLDSDQVKLDIDTQLRGAFEGDKPVAVINRFEELPPGSTLIFYRYCDHENAAYKKVFLAFTVLLTQKEMEEQKSLKDVEEMVHDYIKKRFVDTDGQTGFNEMDVNKFSGLWSRISHLILPVAAEDVVEQKGCQ